MTQNIKHRKTKIGGLVDSSKQSTRMVTITLWQLMPVVSRGKLVPLIQHNTIHIMETRITDKDTNLTFLKTKSKG